MPLFVWLALLVVTAVQGKANPWRLEQPEEARRTGTFADRRLRESSGVAASRRHAGVLWSHNDSGGDPLIFATDTLGRALGAFEVRGAQSEDWEDIALGPCDRGDGTCLYIADTGDNDERRPHAVLYRIPEPAPTRSTPPGSRRPVGTTAPANALVFRYPDGAADVEAMWVSRAGDVHLVTKGRSRGVRHYRLPANAWKRSGTVTAELVQTLPIPRTRSLRQLVTAADVSPDGRWVAVRTYVEIYFFAADLDGAADTNGAPRATGALRVPRDPVACDIGGLELQGEGLAWLDGRRLVLTSERVFLPAGSITVVRCPAPSQASTSTTTSTTTP